jgi:hypothetical protein
MRCHTGIEKLFCQPSPLLQLGAGGREGGGEAEERDRRPCDSVVADMEPRVVGKNPTWAFANQGSQALREGGLALSTLHLFSFDYPLVSEPP